MISAVVGGFSPQQPLPTSWARYAAGRIYPQMMQTRQAMQEAALDLHEAVAGTRPEFKTFQFPPALLEDIIQERIVSVWNERARSGEPLSPKEAEGIAKTVVQEVAEWPARRVTVYAVELNQDDADFSEDVGYARCAVGEYTCSWCMMLVSRGPVYSREEYEAWLADTRGYMDRFHENCDCVMMPVVRSKERDWSGYAQWRAYRDLWDRVTEGLSGQDAVNAWRRWFYAANRDGVDPLNQQAAA